MENNDDNRDSKPETSGIFSAESLKKILTAGVSAAFMTEESIRQFVSEVKLPKEALAMLLQGASKSKDELMNRVSKEIIGTISRIDFVKELTRFLEEHKMRVNAEVEFVRRDGKTSGVRHEFKTQQSSDDNLA